MSSRRHEERPSPLNKNGLRNLIRVALTKGYYRESWHAVHAHAERNISSDDVIHGLEHPDWAFAQPPNYDDGHGNWEYLIKTVDIEGEELHIKIAAFPSEKRFEVITRW